MALTDAQAVILRCTKDASGINKPQENLRRVGYSKPSSYQGVFMARVTGVGGIFFKSEKPEQMYQWYEKNLGIERAPDGSGVRFEWLEATDSQEKGKTVCSI